MIILKTTYTLIFFGGQQYLLKGLLNEHINKDQSKFNKYALIFNDLTNKEVRTLYKKPNSKNYWKNESIK